MEFPAETHQQVKIPALMQIHIPNPCHENWNDMTPADGGRHCARCTRDVVDFTAMTPAEISLYLQLRAGAKVCGRFRGDQMHADLPDAGAFVHAIVQKPWPLAKQLAALLLFVFLIQGSAAEAQEKTGRPPKSIPALVTGEPVRDDRPIPESSGKRPVPGADTSAPAVPVRMGKIAPRGEGGKKAKLVDQSANRYFTGFVAMPPPKK